MHLMHAIVHVCSLSRKFLCDVRKRRRRRTSHLLRRRNQPTKGAQRSLMPHVTHNRSNNDKRGGGRGHKPRGAGAGRGHFLQPTGKAFFTGGGVTSASSAQPTISVSESSTSSAPVKSEDKVRGSGGYGISAQLRGINEEDDFDTREENMSIDSDEEGDAGCADKGTRGRVAEVWPPVEHSSSLPLALPFGPRSQNRRQQLLTQSLFAHPDDTAALSAEERSDMFLLQLPSSLLTPLPTSEPATAEVQKKLASGYIGKLQIMKSGRVFLVLSKERYASSSSAGDEVITRYEVRCE